MAGRARKSMKIKFLPSGVGFLSIAAPLLTAIVIAAAISEFMPTSHDGGGDGLFFVAIVLGAATVAFVAIWTLSIDRARRGIKSHPDELLPEKNIPGEE